MWVVLALLTALAESLKDLWAKRFLLDQIDFLLIAWGLHAGSALFLVPVTWGIDGFVFESTVFPVLAIVATANATVVVLYMFALRSGELSEVVPLLTLTPLFMLLTSPLLLGETPSWMGGVGVVTIVLGAYWLHMPAHREYWYQPFVLLLRKPAAQAMLLIALIWSITGNLDKLGVARSTPLVWGTLTNATIAMLLFPVVLFRSRRQKKFGWKNIRKVVVVLGVLGAIVTFTQMTAITLTLVPYVIAVKRLSILFSVIWGGIVLRERQFRQRLIAASIMVGGAIIITLS